jgi:hypothetical protein
MADMTPTTAFAHAPATAAKTTLRGAVDTLMTAIDTFKTTADSGQVKAQTFAISGTPTGGTYTLTFTGTRYATQTITLDYNAAAATVQTAIRALTGNGFSLTTVTASGTTPNFTHTITFFGMDEDITVSRSIAGMTGGSPVGTLTITSAYAAIPQVPTASITMAKQALVDWCEDFASNLRV